MKELPDMVSRRRHLGVLQEVLVEEMALLESCNQTIDESNESNNSTEVNGSVQESNGSLNESLEATNESNKSTKTTIESTETTQSEIDNMEVVLENNLEIQNSNSHEFNEDMPPRRTGGCTQALHNFLGINEWPVSIVRKFEENKLAAHHYYYQQAVHIKS